MFLTPVPAAPMSIHAAISKPDSYTVQKGDSLSAIAQNRYGHAADWTCIYWPNKKQISNPNVITTGEILRMPTWIGKPCAAPAVVVVQSAPVLTAVSSTPDSTAPEPSHSVSAPVEASTYSGSSSMQECIISRESGGNPDAWNPSGHWGLYQFSEGTWVAHGGNPADFGHAGVAEQNQVFYSTVAADGYSDWAPYDGC